MMATPSLALARAEEKYPHATRARYVFAKCRCEPCRNANREYANARAAATRKPWTIEFAPGIAHGRRIAEPRYVVRNRETGELVFRSPDRAKAFAEQARRNRADATLDPSEFVSSAPARAHIALLRSQGIGERTIAIRARLGRNAIGAIVRGESKRVKRSTSDRILAAPAAMRGAALVPAAPTWELIDDMLATGKRKAWIAREIGLKTPALQLRRDRIQVTSAQKVLALHKRLLAEKRVASAQACPKAKLTRFLDDALAYAP